jgi:hypothetical protein
MAAKYRVRSNSPIPSSKKALLARSQPGMPIVRVKAKRALETRIQMSWYRKAKSGVAFQAS